MADSDSFYLLKETFFGSLLCETWESSGRDLNEFLNSFPNIAKSNNNETLKREAHERQIVYNVVPEQIRKSISVGNYDDVLKKFKLLIGDETGEAGSPRPDIALELLEWIFSGFDQDQLVLDILKLFMDDRIILPENFIKRLREVYSSSTALIPESK